MKLGNDYGVVFVGFKGYFDNFIVVGYLKINEDYFVIELFVNILKVYIFNKLYR